MGSLAFAVGGGIEGLGKGMNEVGTEQIQSQRQQAIERMKQNFEQEQQQRGFTEQEKLQGKTQQFETAQKEREYQVGMMSASAGRQFEAGQQTEKLHSEEQRTHETAQSRENAALIRAAGAAGNRGAAKAGGEWKAQPVNAGPATKPDGTPDYGAPPHQVMGLVNSRTGAIYNPQGNRLYAWDNDKMQSLRDPKSTNNSVKPGEVEDLLRDPLGTIPDGPNQGLRKSDVFEQAHGYLPKPFIDAATRASQPPQGAGGNPVKLLGGQTVNVPSGGGSQGPEPADPSDMQTD